MLVGDGAGGNELAYRPGHDAFTLGFAHLVGYCHLESGAEQTVDLHLEGVNRYPGHRRDELLATLACQGEVG